MKRILAILLTLVFAVQADAAVTQHWKLDDNAASTTVVATVGTNGTLVGGDNTSVKRTTGPGGSIPFAFLFNGTDDAVDISGASLSRTSGQAASYSLWFKCSTTASSENSIGVDGSAVRIGPGSDTTIVVRDTSATRTFTVAALGTTWHHLLVVITTGDACSVYVDGVASVTNPLTLSGTFAPNRLSRGAAYSDISLAQVKIFDSNESANVAALYAEGVTTASGKATRAHLSRMMGR